MNARDALHEWLSERTDPRMWATVRERRSIATEWVRHHGGRTVRAQLRADVEPSDGFDLVVVAAGIDEEYVRGAKNGALSTLLMQSWRPVFNVRLTLHTFEPDLQQSSYAAYYEAAAQAVRGLLGVGEDDEFNIEW